jgi:hypothetical protein
MDNAQKYCSGIKEYFTDFHNKVLLDELMDRVRKHLFICSACRELYFKSYCSGKEIVLPRFTQNQLSKIGRDAIDRYKESAEYRYKMLVRN